VEKYCRAREATDDNMADIAFCVLNASNTQNIKYLLPFNCNSGCMNVSECYVMRTLAVWLHIFMYDSCILKINGGSCRLFCFHLC